MSSIPLHMSTRNIQAWLCFYQTRSAWSRDQESNKNHSPAYNFAPTVTKFCVMWEGLSLPHDTKFGNCMCKIVDSRVFPIWSLIHGSSWSDLIKAEPGAYFTDTNQIQSQYGINKNIEKHTAHTIVSWSNHMPSKMRDEITYRSPNLNGCPV